MFSRISKLFIVCIVLIAIGVVQQVSADEMEAGTWTRKTDMPIARNLMGSAVVDGKIYVIGGNAIGDEVSFTNLVEEYDPATDTWTKRADMPSARQGVAAAAVDGIIYAIGGWRDGRVFSTVEAYDPATDKWTTKASMPTQRDDMTASVVDGKICVIGGMVSSAVEVYDPATNKWTRKANKPTVRWFDAACVIDWKIYITGGTSGYPVVDTLSTTEVYDPATDTWTQASDMPRPRFAHTASVVDGKMYLIGGVDYAVGMLWREGKLDQAEAEKLFSIVDVYDPETDTWTTAADIPLSREYHTAAVVGGKIYVIGGETGPESIRLSEVYEFDPGLPGALSSVSPAGKLLETWGQVKKVD